MLGNKKLTQKETLFIEEYLKDLNATQAAIRAGYSEKTAANIGSGNLRKPHIQVRLYEALEKRAKRTNIAQDRIVLELARVAFSNMKQFARWDANSVGLLSSDDLDDEATACVKEVSETTNQSGGSTSIKLHDKMRALELLMRHMGMLKDKPDEPPPGAPKPEDQFPAMTKEQAAQLLKERIK